MSESKFCQLEEELKKYEAKILQLQKDFAATRSGSAYGSEYLEVQVKVYQDMIIQTKREILKLKNHK